ncbi:MAG: DEAD/DEAH box helicase, partial [Comamonas sp.]
MKPYAPPPGALALSLAQETVALLPERALWWPRERALFVADVHLGKAASFRALGQPVPSGTTRDNLERLSGLIDALDARSLVVLGDFLHAATAQQAQVIDPIVDWRERHAALRCVLVR